jgi:uncharacterized protein
MTIILSPAKKLNIEQDYNIINQTNPAFLEQSQELVMTLQKYTRQDIKKLMSLSDSLAELNYHRFQDFNKDSEQKLTAIHTFAGEVYNGLDAQSFSKEDLDYANDHLRILSGLYGILRPLDIIKEYRLEMGTKLENSKGPNLYKFWQEKLTNYLNSETKNNIIFNLASNEYFKAINEKGIKSEIITPIFKDYKNGEYKIIMMYAKHMRGVMAKYLIKNKINDLDSMLSLDLDGYKYAPELSDLTNRNKKVIFTRKTK